jgi:WD40 repeat protein
MSDPVKSSLYCVRCNTILRDAVEVRCCHALYCQGCIDVAPDNMPATKCVNCARDVLMSPTPNMAVRRLVGSIPMPCPNEGCGEILPAGVIADHIQRRCGAVAVPCKHFERGCAASILRKHAQEHEAVHCAFRDVNCPQGCGALMQYRECEIHFRDLCPNSLIECEVRCGELVRRRELHQHLRDCIQRPLACPYRALGCSLDIRLRRDGMLSHMAASINTHFALVDGSYGQMQRERVAAMPLLARPLSHDWDPTTVQCVDKWDAQVNTITAMIFYEDFLLTGCEAGSVMMFQLATGDLAGKFQPTGEPIRSFLAFGDGRLMIGTKYHMLQLWSNRLTKLCSEGRIHPENAANSNGLVQMRSAVLDKQTHFSDPSRLKFLHAEMYEGPSNPADRFIGIKEVVFAALEHSVRMLDAASLEEICCVRGGHFNTVTSMLVEKDSTLLITGALDCTVRIHDLTDAALPLLNQFERFPGELGVTALCLFPSTTTLAVGCGDGTVGFWNFGTASPTATGSSTTSSSFAPGGPKVSTSCSILCPQAHKGRILTMCAVDSVHVVTGGSDEYWRVWSQDYDFPVADTPGSTYCSAAASGMLFAAGTQGCVRLWTPTTLRFSKKRLPFKGGKKELPLQL